MPYPNYTKDELQNFEYGAAVDDGIAYAYQQEERAERARNAAKLVQPVAVIEQKEEKKEEATKAPLLVLVRHESSGYIVTETPIERARTPVDAPKKQSKSKSCTLV